MKKTKGILTFTILVGKSGWKSRNLSTWSHNTANTSDDVFATFLSLHCFNKVTQNIRYIDNTEPSLSNFNYRITVSQI